MAVESATTRKLGPIGDKILFENEHVRVWSVTLDPGQRQPWHQHLLPYLIVPLTEGKNEMKCCGTGCGTDEAKKTEEAKK